MVDVDGGKWDIETQMEIMEDGGSTRALKLGRPVR